MANFKSNKNGFTLIELLITIFIVSIGLVGVISFFNSSLADQFEAKNEVIAAGLAQEATELVRNIVDYNFLNNGNWYANLTDSSGTNSVCTNVDYNSLASHSCLVGNTNPKVCFENSRYKQCASGSTPFARTVVIVGEDVNGSGVNLNLGDCLRITATVSWDDRETEAVDIICKPRQ